MRREIVGKFVFSLSYCILMKITSRLLLILYCCRNVNYNVDGFKNDHLYICQFFSCYIYLDRMETIVIFGLQ